MTSTANMAAIAVGVLLSCGASTIARADIPSGYSPQAGTVLSTHIPGDNVCPTTQWRLTIGPSDTVMGSFGVGGTDSIWRLTGTYDSHGTFHLSDREPGGAGQTGTVDAQLQSDGSLSLRMTTPGDASPCDNRVVYLPWFRGGNDFDPNGGASGGF
jgi:hypothetical protein